MTDTNSNDKPLSFSLYNRLRSQRNIGIQEGLHMALDIIINLKQIKSWESDGEKIIDIYLDADDKTKDVIISAIKSLISK